MKKLLCFFCVVGSVFADSGVNYTASSTYSSWSGTLGSSTYHQPVYVFTAGDKIAAYIALNSALGGTVGASSTWNLYFQNTNAAGTANGTHNGTVVSYSCGPISGSCTLTAYGTNGATGAVNLGNLGQSPFMVWNGTAWVTNMSLTVNGLAGFTIGSGTPSGAGASGTGSLRVLTWSVTNNAAGLVEYGILEWPPGVTPSVSNSDGVVIDPHVLAAGQSQSWTMTVAQNDSYTYAVEPIDYAGTVLKYGQEQAFQSGSAMTTNPDGSRTFDYSYSYGVASTLTNPPLAWSSGSAYSSTVPATGSSMSQTAINSGINESGVMLPVPLASTVPAAGSNTASGVTTGPGASTFSTDTGLSDTATSINTNAAANATGIRNEIAADTATSMAQAHGDAVDILNGLSQVSANTAAATASSGTGIVSAVNSNGANVVSAINTAAATAHTDANTLNTSLSTINSELSAFGTAASGGTAGAASLASAELTAVQSTVAGDLGGSGTSFNNGTFYTSGTPDGVGASVTGSANGILASTSSDTPFGTVTLVNGHGSFPSQNLTFSLSTLMPWWNDFRVVWYNALAWGALAAYIFAVQHLFGDAMKIIVGTPPAVAQIGPETIAVPGGSLVKLYAVAGVWITVIASIWGGLITIMGSDFSGLGISISSFFSGNSIASSLPSSMGAAAGVFGVVCGFFPFGVWFSLGASYWCLKWQQMAVLLSAASLVKFITA